MSWKQLLAERKVHIECSFKWQVASGKWQVMSD
jgi:hypothetical protein